MAGRYERLYSSYDKLYSQGSPVVIDAIALLKDIKEDKILAQLKFQNIEDKNILAVNVGIRAFDSFGKELQGVDEYQYTDLRASLGNYWGQDKAIALPNSFTRNIEIIVKRVIFSDNTIWKSSSNEWFKLSEQKELTTVLNDELFKQYKIEHGEEAQKVYLEEKGVWHCVCGSINQLNMNQCHHCKADRNEICTLDIVTLKQNADARIAEEECVRKEKERIQEERKKELKEKEIEKEHIRKGRLKIVAFVVSIFVVIAGVLIGASVKNSRSYEKSEEYIKGIEWYEDEVYLQALRCFEKIGYTGEEYLESCYQLGVNYIKLAEDFGDSSAVAKANYERAWEILTKIKEYDYKDNQELLKEVEYMINCL